MSTQLLFPQGIHNATDEDIDRVVASVADPFMRAQMKSSLWADRAKAMLAYSPEARRFPSKEQLEQAKANAVRLEEAMTDAGKAGTLNSPLYIQYDDRNAEFGRVVDALISDLMRSGHYSFTSTWDDNLERLEIRAVTY